ncbi:KTSC domain-containing protein [Rhizobium sp. WYJ-E13]|jgi:hypothetical protein|uniref:KTSC domain-containing protein n=1 Tax=unclassified Rhizobium TaxID=2613769 RepID=UPI000DE17A62|nr:KTSC domain-containing protein [Rhizobium sp. WYJ-E13]QWW66917.1 KTSC domain-containing protein [Rhizobium sp. WYJ-E13]
METRLQSKLIEAIDYKRETRHLTLYLTNGQRRHYEDVPEGIVVGLAAAASPGDFYMSQIRGRFRTT